jgi:hypothetical protein
MTAEALEGMAAAENAADMRVVAIIDAEIDRLNATGREWSANDLRESLPTCSPGLVGARINAARLRRPREMRPTGWVASTLPSTHGKPVTQWVGVDS